MASVSQCRQNYHEDSEAGVNKQINMELFASYTYMSMVRTGATPLPAQTLGKVGYANTGPLCVSQEAMPIPALCACLRSAGSGSAPALVAPSESGQRNGGSGPINARGGSAQTRRLAGLGGTRDRAGAGAQSPSAANQRRH